ncbi:MAG: AbrB/MazE/SpoVT family DNA-binding domain-containing protein [Thermoplasmata archaeon]
MRSGPSLVVVLPVDWARGMNIQAGDIVEVVYDGVVRVRPFPRERNEEREPK